MKDLITLGQAKPEVQRKFMVGVYLRMAFALVITAVCAYFTASNYELVVALYKAHVIYAVVIAELLLVIVLSSQIRKLPRAAAAFFFLLYSVLTGVSLSSIFIIYNVTSIYMVFGMASAMFIGMSIYGAKTKTSLNSAGRYLYMALIGLVIASLVNILFKSSMFEWVLSLAGIGIFIGITAYDTQKLMHIAAYNDDSDSFKKMEIIGALDLYLDFINIFLKLLYLFGRKK